MNSMLQCLSHCEPLRQFFVSGAYAKDLNYKNPLGTGGELAKAFADLLVEIWSGDYQVVAPKRFKQVLGQVNSQFQGFQQHDSQELLTLLADSLHEDLNRIKSKPATGPVESGGRPDEIVAKESWDTFKKRNDSKIVDEMYGLMKSHLVCNVCKKEAVKFDAYSNVSVPVPSTIMAKVKVVFVDSNLKATRCVVSVPKRAPARALADWLCSKFLISDPDDLIIAEIFHNKTAFFYHRSTIQGGLPVADSSGEGFERKNWKAILDAALIMAWQLPTKKEVEVRPKAPAWSMTQFESRWSGFFKEIDLMVAASSSPANDSMVTRCKELFSTKYSQELSGPYTVAQKRLVKGLATVKSMEVAQALAREAIRLAEVDSTLTIAIEPDLIKEAGQQQDDNVSVNGSVGDQSGTTSESTGTIKSKKSASPFRIFRPWGTLTKDSNGGSGSPLVPPRTSTPPNPSASPGPTNGPAAPVFAPPVPVIQRLAFP